VIVPCPNCNTRFYLAEENLGREARMLQCSRCRHIFPAPATQQRADGSGKRAAAAEAGRELSFDDPEWPELGPKPIVDDSEEKYVLGADDELRGPLSAAAGREGRGRSTGEGAPSAAARRPRSTPKALDGHDDMLPSRRAEEIADLREEGVHEVEEHEKGREESASRHGWGGAASLSLDFGDADEAEMGSADEAPPGEEAPMKQPRRSFGPIYSFLAVVVGAYLVLTRSLLAEPELADRLAARLPVVGNSLAADRLLARKVALVDVAGTFQRTRDGREVFLVTGNALNSAPRVLRTVEIEAVLLDVEGRELARGTAGANSLLSRRLVPDLTLREVEILRRVEPFRPQPLRPGESAPFAIVFSQPPPGAATYECRVVAVQRAG